VLLSLLFTGSIFTLLLTRNMTVFCPYFSHQFTCLYTHATSRCFVRHKLDNQSKAQHEVTYRTVNYVNLLTVGLKKTLIPYCYSLFDCCNAGLVFELAPRRARQLVPIYVVIKYRLRMTRLQFYA
jgi:hypothetical protein